MSGHYCTEHKTVFFKKGAMRGYAHPIEGTDPVKWCNEPEDGGAEIPEAKKAELAVEPQEPPNPQAVGMITKEIGDMIRAERLNGLFGHDIAVELIKWYRHQTLGITRVPFDGEKLPKFEK